MSQSQRACNLTSGRSVSIIIVTRNEERKIAACLESVLDCLAERSGEVILVDSFSEDRTIEVASTYPVTILRLKKDWPHSAAAGFHIGLQYATGDLVCFIGGDMVLRKEWFNAAITAFVGEDVAGVSGLIANHFDDDCESTLVARRISKSYADMAVGPVSVLGGPAMFRRKVLIDVGGYHPFLGAGEEAELSARIRARNLRLLRLPLPMADHYSECPTLESFLVKYEWRYALNVGRGIRYSLRQGWKTFGQRINYVSTTAIVLGLLTFLATSILLLIIHQSVYPAALAFSLYAAVIALSYRRRGSLDDALLSIVIIHLRAVAVGLGFLSGVPNPEVYPKNPIVVRLNVSQNHQVKDGGSVA